MVDSNANGNTMQVKNKKINKLKGKRKSWWLFTRQSYKAHSKWKFM